MECKFILILLSYLISAKVIASNDIPQKIINELCLLPCPKIMDPVCATDGNIFQLFNSPCLMLQHSCEYQKEWIKIELDSCLENNGSFKGRSLCERPCPFIYLPICGHNGKDKKIFPNECVMETQNCFLKNKYIKTKFADCNNIVPI